MLEGLNAKGETPREQRAAEGEKLEHWLHSLLLCPVVLQCPAVPLTRRKRQDPCRHITDENNPRQGATLGTQPASFPRAWYVPRVLVRDRNCSLFYELPKFLTVKRDN